MIRKTLLAFVVLLGIAAVLPAEGRRIALVIGNGAYSGVPKLDNPANDANDMAVKLAILGFSVTKLVDADILKMEAAESSFANDAKNATIRFFYYAGHAVQSEGVNWLLPVDALIKEAYELKAKAFSAQEVLDSLKDAGPGINVIVLG